MAEEKVWATPEYETKLLQEILSRVERELKIDNATPKEKEDIIRKELLECYNDPVYFIENYLYTDKNPRFFSKQIQTLVPFLLFDYQVETIDILLDAVNK